MSAPRPDPGSLDATFVGRRRPTVAAAELEGEVVLYDEDTDRVHVLNPTAGLVWDCLDGETSLAELAAELSRHFQADRDVVHRQVLDLARQLAQEGLVVEASDSPDAAGRPPATEDPAEPAPGGIGGDGAGLPPGGRGGPQGPGEAPTGSGNAPSAAGGPEAAGVGTGAAQAPTGESGAGPEATGPRFLADPPSR